MNTCPIGIATECDVKDAMVFGLNSCKKENILSSEHPLQSALQKHAAKKQELEVSMLNKLQGMHAPLRLHMEKMAVKDIGHLPCLHRHNALLDALTGNDETMEFEDFLNTSRDAEVMGVPHMMIEKQLGML
uniref:EOG090X0J8E n=1 Tax=Evadne anonyx TaxID=141404 RepID=A0A9N6WVD9_9CRUS|nr:EOG090X0J8E [Evadne anonyx]